MQRRDFLRNTLMAFAVSLVPKILQPCIPEVPKLIAGYVKISKQMLNDLPFLQSYLPKMITRRLIMVEGYNPNKEIEISITDQNEDCFTQNLVTVIGSQVI